MQLKFFWAALLRRWYLVLVALALTAAATVLVVSKVGPTYQAVGAVMLFPPVTTVQQGNNMRTDGNPYLMLSGLNQARDIVMRVVSSKATREEICQARLAPDYEAMRTALCQEEPTVSYEITPDYTNNAPVILITVDAKSASNAVTGELVMMDQVPKALIDLQSRLGLAKESTITSMPIQTDRKPDVVRKYQIRAGIVTAAASLTVALLLIGLFDGLAAIRRARRQSSGRRAQSALDGFDDEVPPGLGEWPEEVRDAARPVPAERHDPRVVGV